jgi:hypothetical protein
MGQGGGPQILSDAACGYSADSHPARLVMSESAGFQASILGNGQPETQYSINFGQNLVTIRKNYYTLLTRLM